MKRWQDILKKSVCDVDTLAQHFGYSPAETEALRQVALRFPFRIPPDVFARIRGRDDPLYRQFVPDAAELWTDPDADDDPLAEEAHTPAPGIVHRYPDRCLFLVSGRCAAYCRFCTRKRQFGGRTTGGEEAAPRRLEEGFRYIAAHPEIRDVLVSGGDPLLLDDAPLEEILRRLRAIPHVEILRIGTRAPVTLPERITLELARRLKRFHPLFINVHVNHPAELTPATVRALGRLADAGIPLGSQTVLLKGVNDTPEVMRRLMHGLLKARVRPYYIFQSDLVSGNRHFRTPVATGLEIIRSLRGWTSGMAVPHFAIDTPHGGGKIPLLPTYLERTEGRRMIFHNYCGAECFYPDVPPDTP